MFKADIKENEEEPVMDMRYPALPARLANDTPQCKIHIDLCARFPSHFRCLQNTGISRRQPTVPTTTTQVPVPLSMRLWAECNACALHLVYFCVLAQDIHHLLPHRRRTITEHPTDNMNLSLTIIECIDLNTSLTFMGRPRHMGGYMDIGQELGYRHHHTPHTPKRIRHTTHTTLNQNCTHTTLNQNCIHR